MLYYLPLFVKLPGQVFVFGIIWEVFVEDIIAKAGGAGYDLSALRNYRAS